MLPPDLMTKPDGTTTLPPASPELSEEAVDWLKVPRSAAVLSTSTSPVTTLLETPPVPDQPQLVTTKTCPARTLNVVLGASRWCCLSIIFPITTPEGHDAEVDVSPASVITSLGFDGATTAAPARRASPATRIIVNPSVRSVLMRSPSRFKCSDRRLHGQ